MVASKDILTFLLFLVNVISCCNGFAMFNEIIEMFNEIISRNNNIEIILFPTLFY